MTDLELQKIVEEISKDSFGLAFAHKARFNTRLSSTGGRYLLKTHDIELNPKHYRDYGFEELESIIKHELCHYHLHLAGKGYKHGDRDFKELINKTGTSRHCKALKGRTYKYLYRCSECGVEYKRIRVMDTTKYRCGKCRGKIVSIS